MSNSSEKHIRTRGRPRVNPYINIADFLTEFEELKKDYLFRKVITATLLQCEWKILEGSESGQETKDGYKGFPYQKFRGSGIKCSKCNQISNVKEFTIDEGHKPPRIRFTLECGHRHDIIVFTSCPVKCPNCGGEVILGDDGLHFCVLCKWKEEKDMPKLDLSEEDKKVLRRIKAYSRRRQTKRLLQT
jgi:hypothetical protein